MLFRSSPQQQLLLQTVAALDKTAQTLIETAVKDATAAFDTATKGGAVTPAAALSQQQQQLQQGQPPSQILDLPLVPIITPSGGSGQPASPS